MIQFVKSKGLECRFSSEDSFRSDLVDLLNIYSIVSRAGVDRVGIADTIGCASPRQVYDLVRTLRGVVHCDIECHFHNGESCCDWFYTLVSGFSPLDVFPQHQDLELFHISMIHLIE